MILKPGFLDWHSLNGQCSLDEKKSSAPRKSRGVQLPVPPRASKFISVHPSAAYTSLRFAGVAQRTPPRAPAVFAPPKAVSRTLHAAAAEIVLRCAGSAKRGLIGAERFASNIRRSLPRG